MEIQKDPCGSINGGGPGAPTTVGEEREGNPFLVPHFGGRPA